MASANVTLSPLDELYSFIYPGQDCETLCIFAISIALIIVVVGFVIFIALLFFICFSMPSKKAEKEMKAVRQEMRREWDERKKLKTAAAKPVKVRTDKKEEPSGNGCDRSSSFFHVNFRDPNKSIVRFEAPHEDVEMQPLTSSANPLARPSTIIIAPPDIIIEHSSSQEDEEKTPVAEDVVDETVHDRFPTYDEVPGDEDVINETAPPRSAEYDQVPGNDDERVPFRRSASYDEVFETPRASIASFVLNRPLLTEDYYSDDEYLDARSRAESVMESGRNEEGEEEKDSDRTLTLTSNN